MIPCPAPNWDANKPFAKPGPDAKHLLIPGGEAIFLYLHLLSVNRYDATTIKS